MNSNLASADRKNDKAVSQERDFNQIERCQLPFYRYFKEAMDDDDSWDFSREAEKPTSSPSTDNHFATPEPGEPFESKEEPWEDDEPEEKESKPQKQEDKKSNPLDQSNWMEQIEKQQKVPFRKQETSFNQNTSFLQGADLLVGEEKELTPNEVNTTWLNQSEDKKKTEERPKGRGNRDYNKKEEEEEREPPKRGNRNSDDNRDGGVQRRGNRGNREGQEPSGRANQGFGEAADDSGPPRRGNREGGGGYFKKKQRFQTGETGPYERGGGYRGRGRGGGYNNNYNREYSNNYRGNNPRTQIYRQKGQNDPSERFQRPFNNQEREERPNYNSYNSYRPRNYEPPVYQPAPPPPPPPPAQEQPIAKKDSSISISGTQKMVPKGRKCWPETSINILSCKLVLTARQLSDFRCKMLVIPYSTLQMEYYPGNLINSSTVDYRKKIMNKGSQIQSPGAIYLQKAIEVYTFEAICFIKVDKGSVQQSLKKGIFDMLKLVEKIEKPITLQTLVFPICQELGDPAWVVDPFLDNLQNCRKVREVWITTIQGSSYIKAASAFNGHLQKLFKANEIFLNA